MSCIRRRAKDRHSPVILTAAEPDASVLTLPTSVSARSLRFLNVRPDPAELTEVTDVPLGVGGGAVALAVGVEVGSRGGAAVATANASVSPAIRPSGTGSLKSTGRERSS